ncbi:hypothetical protein ONE63_005821 [Megalurothrips usitatus]|uniref:Protein kintoun n=1 Tax=Megalurothrips usitatus TaxID=439358 RepID=A0AAV7XZV4_9NEOP|nr:hypothetical protein ONE63_005821 [Megalurothrips usitatus]
MEARKKRFEELNITRDEINNIGKALQKEEFRKLFLEYCEEVTSPESKKIYQTEVTELEKQRGVDVTFINPEPGFVIKTSIDGDRKAFINICKNDKVKKPTSSAASEKGSRGQSWSLPFSLAPPREDYDKLRNHCTVFDVVFHPETIQLAEKNGEFRKMVINTALDAVEDNCHAKLDRANLKYPKMTYKGLPQAAVIRKKIPNHQAPEDHQELLDQIPYPVEGNTWTTVQKGKKVTEKKEETVDYTPPKYSIKYRHDVELSDFTNDVSSRLNATVPKALIISIDLPLLKSAKDLSLDISHKSLSLQCEMPKYKLNLVLPYGVDENAGNASFDATTRKLLIELPVKRIAPSLIDVGREDSGVESDPGGRADDESDDKSRSDNSDGGSDTGDQSLQEVFSPDYNGDDQPDTDGFLKKDIEYMLPNFSLNIFENTVAVVLHVKNVESSSVAQKILSEGRGIHLSFTSLGGGLFPQSYGFCMAFPSNAHMEPDSLTVEVWDNNVVVQVVLTSSSSPITESDILVGVGLDDLRARDITNLAVVEQMFADLQVSTENAESRSPLVEVHVAEENELVLKIEPFNSGGTEEENNVIESSASDKLSESPTVKALEKTAEKLEASPGRRNAVRLYSECSSDDVNGKKIRGILKKRPVRSLSESNVDDYPYYQLASLSDESGPNSVMGSVSCIGEGGSETGCETENESGDRQSKKTVRFNDVVAQQVFRPNSSILGQRKKNQRKQKNKKRAQERKASESEYSEQESEQEKARRRSCHSEGEASDFEDKNNMKKKIEFLKDLKVEPCNPQAKKILRRTNSSESDDDVKEGKAIGDRNMGNPAGDSSANSDTSGKMKKSFTTDESSEDERDEKTEDKKKKKKKRKAKNVGENGDGCKVGIKKTDKDFQSDLVHELEM